MVFITHIFDMCFTKVIYWAMLDLCWDLALGKFVVLVCGLCCHNQFPLFNLKYYKGQDVGLGAQATSSF